jgi:hypothetical protein
MRESRRPDEDRMIVAGLMGEAPHHARWELPGEEITEAAVADLRKIAGGRTDLLAEVAGIFLGTSEGELHEPRAQRCRLHQARAGQDTRKAVSPDATSPGPPH